MIYRFETLASTNSAMVADAQRLDHGDVYCTDCQTAGRGQRGNSWEADPGLNLTFSMMLRPTFIPASQAFAVSMLVSVALADTLAEALGRDDVAIKWPNDIYVGDRKLVGILIENSFSRVVDRAVAGIGINVNQAEFRSDAPNPVSMLMVAGHEFDLAQLLDKVVGRVLGEFESYRLIPDIEALTERYRSRLWRGTGVHRWLDRRDGTIVEAAIAGVAPDGMLTLDTKPARTYAFKEISPVIDGLYLKC